MFGVVSAWTWFDCLVSWDESPSEQRVHWSLVLVLVLVDDLVPKVKFNLWARRDRKLPGGTGSTGEILIEGANLSS